jgi:hypothetical protein
MSGTTIYGSTAVCSAVGKFTTCLDLGGALTGTSATFSGNLAGSGYFLASSITGLVTIQGNAGGNAFNQSQGLAIGWNYTAGGGEVAFSSNKGAGSVGGFKFYDWNGTTATQLLSILPSGAATFANTVTAAGIITGTTGVNVGANALGADRMFQVSGTSFTTGTTQFGVVVNPSFCGTITNVFGVYAGNNFSAGTITNSYNLYIEGTSAGSATITNRYGIYQVGGSDRNYFAGNVGINTTTPCAKLQVNSSGGDFAAEGTLLITRAAVATGDGSEIRFQYSSTNRAYQTAIRSVVESYGGTDAASLQFLTQPTYNTLATRMTITGGGNVLLACSTDFNKGAKLQITQNSSNTNAIDFKNTDVTYSHIGTFANNTYLTQNYYYAGGQNNDCSGYGQAAITLGVGTVIGETSIDFAMSDPGATSPSSKMRLFSAGILLVGTTTCTAEANLILGAKGTTEGGQMIFQKGTSFQCATHLDNYSNCFRIMSGTDTGSTTVNMSINHVNGNATFGSSVTANTITGTNGVNTVSTVSSINFTSWTTLVTIDSNTTGMYLIVIGLTGGGTLSDWTATGIIYSNGTTAAWLTGPTNGALVQLRINGLAVQVYQNGTNPSISLSYKLLKIS